MDVHDFWNAALTIGMFFIGFFLNRMTTVLDRLQDADTKLSNEIQKVRTEFVPKSEFIAYGDRLERRLEQYMSLQTETSKSLFQKLDIITERMSEKVSRAECLSNQQNGYRQQ